MLQELKILCLAKKALEREANALKIVAENLDHQFTEAVLNIKHCQGKIVCTGIGKSAYIAQKIVASFHSIGVRSQFLHASEAIHGDIGMLKKEDLVICLSKSGNSPEIRSLVPHLKKRAAYLVAITAEKESYLARKSDVVLIVYEKNEADKQNLIPTISTTSQLALGDALLVAIAELNEISKEDFAYHHPGGTLGKKLLWTVDDIMSSRDKPFVGPKASIKEVIISISKGQLGMTVVIKEDRIVGVITDGDLRRMLEKESDFSHLSAQNIMSLEPKCIEKESLAMKAAEMMQLYNIGQLIVMEKGNYQGIINFHDLLKEGIHL